MTSGPIVVRHATRADLPLLADWVVAFLEHLRGSTADPYFTGAEFSRADAAAGIEAAMAADQLVLVAEIDGRPVGYLLARIETPYVRESPIREIGHISHCYVEPAARRRGVVRSLVREAEEWFRARDLPYAQLSYQLANDLAAATWSKLGYEPFRVYARRRLTREKA